MDQPLNTIINGQEVSIPLPTLSTAADVLANFPITTEINGGVTRFTYFYLQRIDAAADVKDILVLWSAYLHVAATEICQALQTYQAYARNTRDSHGPQAIAVKPAAARSPFNNGKPTCPTCHWELVPDNDLPTFASYTEAFPPYRRTTSDGREYCYNVNDGAVLAQVTKAIMLNILQGVVKDGTAGFPIADKEALASEVLKCGGGGGNACCNCFRGWGTPHFSLACRYIFEKTVPAPSRDVRLGFDEAFSVLNEIDRNAMDAGYTDPYGFLDLAALARLRRAFLFFINVAGGFRIREYHLFCELVSMSMRSSMEMEQDALFGARPVDAGTQTRTGFEGVNPQRAPGAEQAPAPGRASAPNGGEERGGGAADESAADPGSDSGTESSGTFTKTPPKPRSRSSSEGATDEVLHNHRDGQVKKKKASAGKARRARQTESEKLKRAVTEASTTNP
ncbi:hypothetical protein YB2330_003780 [Saitoella coloradoensis]